MVPIPVGANLHKYRNYPYPSDPSALCLVIGFFMSAAAMMNYHSLYPPLDVEIELAFLLVGPVLFLRGAWISGREVGRRAKVLRWLNVIGLAVSVGFFLVYLSVEVRYLWH